MKNKTLAPSPVCKNCGSENFVKYCSNCGQKTYTHRFTLKSFFGVFWDAFSIERGFIHTLKMLFIKPGKVVNEYLYGKTKAYFNPLKYALILAGLHAILILSLNIFDTSIESQNEMVKNYNEALVNENAMQLQEKWVSYFKQYINIFSLLTIPFVALACKCFFRKRKLYYGEHLIVVSFIYAQTLLVISILSPIVLIFPSFLSKFSTLGFIASILYYSYALKSVFKRNILKSFTGGLFIYILGNLLFMLLFIIILVISILLLIFVFKLNIADLL